MSAPAEEAAGGGASDRFLDVLCTCTSPRGLHAGTSSNHILHLNLRGPPTLIITRKSGFAAQILKPENSGKIILISGSCTKEKKKALHEEKDEGDAKNIPLLHIQAFQLHRGIVQRASYVHKVRLQRSEAGKSP